MKWQPKRRSKSRESNNSKEEFKTSLMKDYRNTKDLNSVRLKKRDMLREFTKISPQKKTILSLSSNAGSPISSRKGNVVSKEFSK